MLLEVSEPGWPVPNLEFDGFSEELIDEEDEDEGSRRAAPLPNDALGLGECRNEFREGCSLGTTIAPPPPTTLPTALSLSPTGFLLMLVDGLTFSFESPDLMVINNGFVRRPRLACLTRLLRSS
jgi:hypothetical protein